MIGFISGKFLLADESGMIVVAGGVGYNVITSARLSSLLLPGQPVELYIHTNLRENALELFGFETPWEKRVFLALTSVSGVGPRTAISMLGGLDGETILSAIVREDRATLTSVSGIGKKTAERLLVELGDKARKLLTERPVTGRDRKAATATAQGASALAESNTTARAEEPATTAGAGATAAGTPRMKTGSDSAAQSNLDVADLWNEALEALVNLGYREGDAIAAIRMASNRSTEAGETVNLERLIRSSLQLMSKGIGT